MTTVQTDVEAIDAQVKSMTAFSPAPETRLTVISNPSGMITTKREIVITRYHNGCALYKEKGKKRMGVKEFVKRSWLADEMVFEGWDLPIQADSEATQERFCHLDNKLNVGLHPAGDELLDARTRGIARLLFLRSFVDALQLNSNFTAHASIMVVGATVDDEYTPLYPDSKCALCGSLLGEGETSKDCCPSESVTDGEDEEAGREDFYQQIDTQEPNISVGVSFSDSLDAIGNSANACLLQIGAEGDYTCAYLTDLQVKKVIDALTAYLVLPRTEAT